MIRKLLDNIEHSAEISVLLDRFNSYFKWLNKWSLCFIPLLESYDYTHILDKVVCAYISNSCWKFSVMRRIA